MKKRCLIIDNDDQSQEIEKMIRDGKNKYGIEYSVKRNLKFTAWRTSEGNNYIGGRWTRSF